MGCAKHPKAKLVRDPDDDAWSCGAIDRVDDGVDVECSVYVCPDHEGRDLVAHEVTQHVAVLICVKCHRKFTTYTEVGRAARDADAKEAAKAAAQPPAPTNICIVKQFETPNTIDVVVAVRDLITSKGPLADDEVILLACGLVPRLYILNITTGAIIDHGDVEG